MKNSPWSVHALLGFGQYRPWGDVLNPAAGSGLEEVVLAGLYEEERAIEEIDIFTFEARYPDHLSDEQLARELFVSTGTVRTWVAKGKVVPAVRVPFGRSQLNYYAPVQIEQIRRGLGLKAHDETTQYQDFFELLEERTYTMSYKMVLLLCMLGLLDHQGECDLDKLSVAYADFYKARLAARLPVDRPGCPYTVDVLQDLAYVKESILSNPFEKFERKRFLYQCKDLNRIGFSGTLWLRLAMPKDLDRIRTQMFDDLVKYYAGLGGVPNAELLKQGWDIPRTLSPIPSVQLVESPPPELLFVEFVPYYDMAAAAGRFDAGSAVGEMPTGWLHLPDESLREGMFVMTVRGHSMEPQLADGSLALFRLTSEAASGRIVLSQLHADVDSETGYSFTVKQLRRDPTSDDAVELISLNPDFPTIRLGPESAEQFRVIGEFVKTVAPG
jgi:SOS-response transcriptional repressor LexA